MHCTSPSHYSWLRILMLLNMSKNRCDHSISCWSGTLPTRAIAMWLLWSYKHPALTQRINHIQHNKEHLGVFHEGSEVGKRRTHMSLAMEEFRDIDLGERSQSLSERQRNDSLRWLWTKLACRMRPEPGLAIGSRGLRPDDVPLSTSKLHMERKRGGERHKEITMKY